MSPQVAPCVRQIGSSISSVFVDSILYELDVKLRDEVAPVGCFVGEVDDDEPRAYRNKLCEETFYDLCLNQRSSHSKGVVNKLTKIHCQPLKPPRESICINPYARIFENPPARMESR